jgi:zinc transporter ZupT
VSTVEKIFAGFTAVAIFATLFTSPYTSTILGSFSGGVANIYTAVKH